MPAIGAFYFAYLGALGLFAPYFPLYLRSLGLSEGAAARLQGVVPAMGLLSPPLLGLLADAQRARPHLLRATSLLAALGFALLLVVPLRWPLIAAAVALFALARMPITPLIDASAAAVAPSAAAFGRLRVWGSIGFLVTVGVGGAAFDAVGIAAMRLATVAALAVAAALSFRVPASRLERHPEALSAWLDLVRSGDFRLFLVAVVCAQTASAAYDGGFSMHLAGLGFNGRQIGLLWAVGVLAEIGLLVRRPAWLDRFAPEQLFAAAIAVAALRWLLLARLTSGVAIALLQPLHGISFGLWYISSVMVCRARGRDIPTAALGLFSAAASAGSALGMSVAGELLASGGGARLYGAAAAVAAVGAVAAFLFARAPAAAAAAPPIALCQVPGSDGD